MMENEVSSNMSTSKAAATALYIPALKGLMRVRLACGLQVTSYKTVVRAQGVPRNKLFEAQLLFVSSLPQGDCAFESLRSQSV